MATEYPFTKQTFVEAIRKKSGNAYAGLDDDKLFSAVTNKFPTYLEQIDPASLAPAPPEKPGLMGRLFEAAKGMFGGGGEDKPALASPTLAAPTLAAPEAVEPPTPPPVPPIDPAELRRLAGTVTYTPENVRKVLVDQTMKAREVAMDAGAVTEWLKARKANRKFDGVTRIDPTAALEVGASKADPVAGVVRNAVAEELVGREVAPFTGLDRFSSELKTASTATPDKYSSVLSMPDMRPDENYSAEERARAYAGDQDLLTTLTRPILGAMGRSVIGKTTGNLANFVQLAANPEKYYSVTGDRSEPTPVEVKRLALDSGMLDDPNPVAKFAGQTLPGFVLGGDAALASVPDVGFPLLAGAHQILDNVARAQKGESPQWDPHQIGVEAAKGMMFSVLPLPKTLTKEEGGIIERAARQLGQVGYQTAAFTAADIAAERKQPSSDDALGTFALLGALHLPKISHEIWAGRIEQKLKSGGMDKTEAATYANAAMDGDPQAQAFVDKFADDASFREAFAGQQRLRSEIKAREQSAKDKQATLIAKARAGDRAAFEELLQERIGGEVAPVEKPHVAEDRRNENLLPAKPGEVRLPAGVDADLRRTEALKKLRDITPVEKLPPVTIPGETGEFMDPNDGALLTYLSKAIPAQMVAQMPGTMRLRLGNNPEELQALSAEVLASGKTTGPAPLTPVSAPVVKTPGAPPPVTVTPPKPLPVPAPPPPSVVTPTGGGKPVPVPPVGGNAFRVKSPLRRDVVASGRFDVVELDQLFNGPQDRNRTRAASNAQTEQVLQNFDEEELGHSVTSDRGAPIVMADGRILAGHGRRNVLTRVYGVGDARKDRYRAFVEAQAAAMGLGDKVKGMKEPVLVRVADKIENATPEQFAELSNQKQMLGYSDAEKAVKDARRLLSSNMIQSLNVTDPDNLLAAGNRDFIASFLDKQDDKAEYLTAEGQAAPALEGRIQRAVLSALVLGDAKAGGESDAAHTVAILVEKAADYGVTPMLKGLTASAPRLLKIRASKPEWDLTASLARVMPEIVRAKEAVQAGKFKKVEDYFRQSDWTRKASPKELEIATLLINAKSAKQISELLDNYTKVAENHDSKTVDMFGGVLPESTPLDVLRRLNNGEHWTTISVEPADHGIGDEGSLGGGKSPVVDVAPNERGSGGKNDDGGIQTKVGSTDTGHENPVGGRYQAVIQRDLDDLNELFGTGGSNARQSDHAGNASGVGRSGNVTIQPGRAHEAGSGDVGRGRGGQQDDIQVSRDGRNHARAGTWRSALERVRSVYGRGKPNGGEKTAEQEQWDRVEVDEAFGVSTRFYEEIAKVERFLPGGVTGIPVKNLWCNGIALPEQGVYLVDSTVRSVPQVAHHEAFHILTHVSESAPLVRRMIAMVNVQSLPAKAYVSGRNEWRAKNGQPPLPKSQIAEEIAAELFSNWETLAGFGGKTYRLNAAIPENAHDEFRTLMKQLKTPREFTSPAEWGESRESDLFDDPKGPSRIQWELERIAEIRGIKPAGWGDYDALATRSLQNEARNQYMASDRFDADPLDKVARVLVGMNDGKVPTRTQAEEFFKARGWLDKLAVRMDEILKRAGEIRSDIALESNARHWEENADKFLKIISSDSSDPKSAKEAMDWWREYGPRVVKNNHGLQADVARSSIEKIISGDKPHAKARMASIRHLDALFGEAFDTTHRPDDGRDVEIDEIIELHAPFLFDGVVYRIRFLVKTYITDGRPTRLHSARLEDVVLEKESAGLDHYARDAKALPDASSPGTITVRQLFNGVNPFEEKARREGGPVLITDSGKPGEGSAGLSDLSPDSSSTQSINGIRDGVKSGESSLADRAEPGALVQKEDLPGKRGGVWEPRAISGGMPEPTTGRAVMTLPALVRLYKEMTGNRAPVVQKRLRILGGKALGAFYPGSGEIKLLASIFDPVSDARKGELLKQARAEVQNPNSSEEVKRYRELLEQEYAKPESKEPRQALATLAHEIGHAYDWLPDRSMAKGNILGRIAAFHQYMNDMLGQLPQFQNLITQDERKAFRAEAAKQARAKIPPVPGATEAQRKERDARVNKLTADIYGRMLADEAQRRNLVTQEQITEELKALTQWWKPFDEDLDPSFTDYRYSTKELMADAISVMMNRPEAMRRIAPIFDKTLFGWMGNRPEFQRVWNEIQAELIGGEADKRLIQDATDGFHRAETQARENLKARRIGWSELVTAIRYAAIDTADPILRKVREYGERELDAIDNPRYAIEDAVYVGSAHEAYLKQLDHDVLKPLRDSGLTIDMMGLYALVARVKKERGHIANPLGIDPATADRILSGFGAEKVAIFKSSWSKFWDLRKQHVLDDLERSGAWSDELMQKARDNEAYATFNILDYMVNQYGSEAGPRVFRNVGPTVKRQTGTLYDVENPFIATIQKDLSLISATLRNEARKKVIEFLQMAFPDEVETAKTQWNGRFQEAMKPSDPRRDLLAYVEKGKLKGFYVDKWVAKHFTHEDPEWLRMVGWTLRATMKPFRFVFTDANPGFWAMNLFRDYHATVSHLPGTWSPVGTYTWHWAKGVREGFKSVFGTPGTVVRDMLKHKMLISMVSRSQEATDEDTILDRLLVQVQPKKLEWSRLSHPAEMISAALDWWTGIGKAFERSNQIASYTWLKKYHPAMTDQEIAHLVRTVASPAFLRKGAFYPIYNNLLMFSNANKEGLRAEAEAFRRGKSAWAIKTAAYVALPRLIIMAIKAGLVVAAVAKVREWFSPDDDRTEKMPGEASLKEMYGLIPEYDLANYLCAPIGMTDGGKVVYLRFPQQENARMIGGIFWKTLQSLGDKELHDVFSDAFSFAGGQVPRANPAFGLLSDIGKLMSGENPIDTFRQQPMIDQTTWEAQDSRTVKAAAKGLWNEAGGGIIIRFRSEDSRSIQTTLEKALGAPFLGNVASRFVKVSDRGLWEDVAKIKEESKRENARERLNVAEMVQGERPFGMDAAAHKDYLEKLLIQKGLREAKNDSMVADPEMIRNLQILKDANSADEKVKLLKMLEKRGYLKNRN